MKKQQILGIALLALTAVCLGLLPAMQAPAMSMPGYQWMVTSNWLNCDQTSAANECANWQSPDGQVYLSCCVPASALGTADFAACEEFPRSRDGRGGL
jgi:hypothetical protein